MFWLAASCALVPLIYGNRARRFGCSVVGCTPRNIQSGTLQLSKTTNKKNGSKKEQQIISVQRISDFRPFVSRTPEQFFFIHKFCVFLLGVWLPHMLSCITT